MTVFLGNGKELNEREGRGLGPDLGMGTIRVVVGGGGRGELGGKRESEHSVSWENSQPLTDFQQSWSGDEAWGSPPGPHTLQHGTKMERGRWDKEEERMQVPGGPPDWWNLGQSAESTDLWKQCEETSGHQLGTPAHYLRCMGLITPLWTAKPGVLAPLQKPRAAEDNLGTRGSSYPAWHTVL